MAERESFVTRCIRPGAPGTRKLLLKYGTDLVCVRYRETIDGRMRATTVELVIDRRPTKRINRLVRIHRSETALLKELRQAGSTLDPATACWVVPATLVKRLRLQKRVVG